jgi:hypothetical protein
VPAGGGGAQRAAQNSFGIVHGALGLQACLVHCNAIVSKQLPVTFPWQLLRQVPSFAKHTAAPVCSWVAQRSKQPPRSLEPAETQLWTHVFAAAPTFVKHVPAALPQPVGHLPGVEVGRQAARQSASDVPQAVRAELAVVRHTRRQARG